MDYLNPNAKPVYAYAQNKRRDVLHGYIRGKTFFRDINSKQIRWSSNSIDVNIRCLSKLKDSGVDSIQFNVKTSQGLNKYALGYAQLFNCVLMTNEVGDDVYRVPLFRCTKT